MSIIEVAEGVRWPPPAKPISGPITAVTQQIFSGPCLLLGYSARTGGTGTIIDLYDGADTSGQPAGTLYLTADASVFPWFGDHGIALERGLTADVQASLSLLVFYVAALWRPGTV